MWTICNANLFVYCLCNFKKRERKKNPAWNCYKTSKILTDGLSERPGKKTASIGKITEEKMSGKYPQLINMKKEKEERSRKII